MKNTPNSKNALAYEKLRLELHDQPWLLKGSVTEIAPRSPSPHAKTTYNWIRKIRGKTVTVALTEEQYPIFGKAIEANRKVEKVLKKMQDLSEKELLNSLPGVQGKPGRGR